MVAEFGSLENLKAKVYRGGVKCIHMTIKSENLLATLGTRFCHSVIGKIIEGSVVP